MTTSLEVAFPDGANWVRDTVLAKLAEAMIGVFTTPNLSAEDFSIQPYKAICVEGPDGDLEFYAYDATDTTTVDDGGVSCIVVSGRRYKKRIDVIVRDSVLSATTVAQPVSPSLGDAYIVPPAPSGTDWASEAKTVATFTARGWIFREPFIGMVVYVEDEESFYHFDVNGDWVLGLGAAAFADGSILPKKLKLPFGLIKVEGTQNTPPVSPTDGIAYQIGTSPTDDWVGHGNHVAIWNASGSGSWDFYVPSQGDHIVRKDVGPDTLYKWSGGAWTRAVSAPVVVQSHYVDDVSVTTNTAALTNRISSPSITAAVGQKIRVTVYAQGVDLPFTSGTPVATAGIRIDSSGVTTKTIWSLPYTSSISDMTFVAFGEIDVPDAAAHVYRIATAVTGTGSTGGYTCRAIFEVIQPS